MWWKLTVIALFVLAFVITVARLYGTCRWHSNTKALLAKISITTAPLTPQSYAIHELEGLPAPVQRYFRAVLKEGQPVIAALSMEHSGTFNMSGIGEQWWPFESRQRVITQRPGFVWDARIRMTRAMTVYVHDAYIAGEGILNAKLFGLFTVMEQPGTPELAQGELVRFFAEGAWYPTALLPNQGVIWEPIDDIRAFGTLTDGSTTVKLEFHFDAQGLISSVRSDGRYREMDGLQVATPWQGCFGEYELRKGMLIPLEGEVAWLLQEGPKPYWRGRVKRIEFEYTQ